MHHFNGGKRGGAPSCRAKWGGCRRCWHGLPVPPGTTSGSPAALGPSSDKRLLFSSTAAAWSISLRAFWKSVNPLRATDCPTRRAERCWVGAGADGGTLSRGGRVGRRREMGWRGRGRRGDVLLPRCGFVPGDARGVPGGCGGVLPPPRG